MVYLFAHHFLVFASSAFLAYFSFSCVKNVRMGVVCCVRALETVSVLFSVRPGVRCLSVASDEVNW